MARFEDFTRYERHVLREAMAWSQSEFYDPGHTQEDRDTLQALIQEARAADFRPYSFGASVDDTPVAPRDTPVAPRDTPVADPDDETGKDVAQTQKPATEPLIEPERREGMTPLRMRSGGEREAAEKPTRKYTGFLYIRCGVCGHIRAFCVKTPLAVYHCAECGGWTSLTNMSRLKIRCECGAEHRYFTNVVTNQMDVACFSCGAPVAVEWNGKRLRYDTIGAYPERRKKKTKRRP